VARVSIIGADVASAVMTSRAISRATIVAAFPYERDLEMSLRSSQIAKTPSTFPEHKHRERRNSV